MSGALLWCCCSMGLLDSMVSCQASRFRSTCSVGLNSLREARIFQEGTGTQEEERDQIFNRGR
jgi:hypothetical protein